jgi:hypothetical protein
MSGSHLVPETEEEMEVKSSHEQLNDIADEIAEVDEVEQSAKALRFIYSNFRKLGYDLVNRKKRAPIRVLESLVFGEFEDVELKGIAEKNLLDLCKQAVYHKNVIYNYTIERERAKEAELAKEKEKEDE